MAFYVNQGLQPLSLLYSLNCKLFPYLSINLFISLTMPSPLRIILDPPGLDPGTAASWKKQENSRKPSISALLTMPKPLPVWITINWKILKEMGIPDHLTYHLRNLYAGQETTVRTGHGTTDCFLISKGVCQGCILSPAYLTHMQSTS